MYAFVGKYFAHKSANTSYDVFAQNPERDVRRDRIQVEAALGSGARQVEVPHEPTTSKKIRSLVAYFQPVFVLT